jgi:hypothetical protein
MPVQRQRLQITAQHWNTDLGDSPIIQCLDVLPCWCGERVVRTTPPTLGKKVLLCVRTREQGKLGDPEKVRRTRWGVLSFTVRQQGREGSGRPLSNPPRD